MVERCCICGLKGNITCSDDYVLTWFGMCMPVCDWECETKLCLYAYDNLNYLEDKKHEIATKARLCNSC